MTCCGCWFACGRSAGKGLLHFACFIAALRPCAVPTGCNCSVVKWVHLNRGDEGLEAMLSKFWRLLVPGGLLLLEPQPWKSYKAAAAKLRKQVGPGMGPWELIRWLEEQAAFVGGNSKHSFDLGTSSLTLGEPACLVPCLADFG